MTAFPLASRALLTIHPHSTRTAHGQAPTCHKEPMAAPGADRLRPPLRSGREDRQRGASGSDGSSALGASAPARRQRRLGCRWSVELDHDAGATTAFFPGCPALASPLPAFAATDPAVERSHGSRPTQPRIAAPAACRRVPAACPAWRRCAARATCACRRDSPTRRRCPRQLRERPAASATRSRSPIGEPLAGRPRQARSPNRCQRARPAAAGRPWQPAGWRAGRARRSAGRTR